jgi:hypothetical protein
MIKEVQGPGLGTEANTLAGSENITHTYGRRKKKLKKE